MSHTHTNILVHAVYSTKHRHPFLADPHIRYQLHHYIGGILKHNGAQPLQVNGVADHVHLLFGIPPAGNVAFFVKESKRASSIWIKTKGTDYAGFAWQTGYSAFAVSESAKDTVRRYIRNQEEHHRRATFQEEWEKLMKANGLSLPEWYRRHENI